MRLYQISGLSQQILIIVKYSTSEMMHIKILGGRIMWVLLIGSWTCSGQGSLPRREHLLMWEDVCHITLTKRASTCPYTCSCLGADGPAQLFRDCLDSLSLQWEQPSQAVCLLRHPLTRGVTSVCSTGQQRHVPPCYWACWAKNYIYEVSKRKATNCNWPIEQMQ